MGLTTPRDAFITALCKASLPPHYCLTALNVSPAGVVSGRGLLAHYFKIWSDSLIRCNRNTYSTAEHWKLCAKRRICNPGKLHGGWISTTLDRGCRIAVTHSIAIVEQSDAGSRCFDCEKPSVYARYFERSALSWLHFRIGVAYGSHYSAGTLHFIKHEGFDGVNLLRSLAPCMDPGSQAFSWRVFEDIALSSRLWNVSSGPKHGSCAGRLARSFGNVKQTLWIEPIFRRCCAASSNRRSTSAVPRSAWSGVFKQGMFSKCSS